MRRIPAVRGGAASRLQLAAAVAASLLSGTGGCATDSPGAPVAAPVHPAFSDMFARTLAAVLAVPGPGLAASVALGLTGSIGSSSLPLCGSPGAQAPTQTRDIRKVQSDQGTTYALDAVTPQEMSTGQYAARQITISFNHR